MTRLAILAVSVLLAACGEVPPRADGTGERPVRIVSLDYCADQYVLKFAERAQILAVSPDAAKPFSYMREAAEGLRTVRPVAEDVLVLKPDLVVRSYGGGPDAERFFEKAGVEVLNIGWAETLDDVMSNVEHVAYGLGHAEKGRAVAAEMKARLDAVRTHRDGASALYVTPAGVTTGPGSLIHQLLLAAGYRNYESAPGWRALPLETLVREQPDVLAAAFFEGSTGHIDAWSPMRHPVAGGLVESVPVVQLNGSWTSCGGWFLADAVEVLAGVRR